MTTVLVDLQNFEDPTASDAAEAAVERALKLLNAATGDLVLFDFILAGAREIKISALRQISPELLLSQFRTAQAELALQIEREQKVAKLADELAVQAKSSVPPVPVLCGTGAPGDGLPPEVRDALKAQEAEALAAAAALDSEAKSKGKKGRVKDGGAA